MIMESQFQVVWDMLSASEFVTSVSSTVGYGDIVPVTFWGKIFVLLYALWGIPVFLWYIIMLGVLLRSIVARATTAVVGFFRRVPITDQTVHSVHIKQRLCFSMNLPQYRHPCPKGVPR